MNLYTYEGPVMVFDTCVATRWVGSTYAPSERKAKSNLEYQFKKQHNKVPNTKVSLPGKIVMIERREKYGRVGF